MGTNPSLSNFTISEIQNEEGRFVNNRMEYGYTDHLGNLRLSYRDSLGIAVVVQRHAYDAWGMEIRPLRYGLSGALADKYTWQGKEDLTEDGLQDWSDFGWRIEDRTLGRWFTPDPADQFQSISPFAYCANNPVSHIDPDGRALPALAVVGIAMAISGATYTAAVGFSRGGFDNWNWNEFGRSVIVGGASSIFTMGIGTAFGNTGTIGNEVARAVMHGHVQGTLSAVQGGNYGTSFLSGAIGSGFSSGSSALNLGDGGVILSGGLSGGVGSSLNGGNFFEGFGQGSIIALANHTMEKQGGPSKYYKRATLKTSSLFNGLNQYEISLLEEMTNAQILEYSANYKLANNEGEFFFKELPIDNNHRNAYVHARAAGLHAKSFGKTTAQKLLNAHERGQGKLPQLLDRLAHKMDFMNNSIGINMPNIDANSIYRLTVSGRLWTLNNTLTSVEQVPYKK
jgi:RHS repeat-associated protein